jgi:hypothetical protein
MEELSAAACPDSVRMVAREHSNRCRLYESDPGRSRRALPGQP